MSVEDFQAGFNRGLFVGIMSIIVGLLAGIITFFIVLR
jgi:hypothetical protein